MHHITSSTLPNTRASDYVDGCSNQICVGHLVQVQLPVEVFDTVPTESKYGIELGVQVDILWGADREDIETKGLAGFKLSERAVSQVPAHLRVCSSHTRCPVWCIRYIDTCVGAGLVWSLSRLFVERGEQVRVKRASLQPAEPQAPSPPSQRRNDAWAPRRRRRMIGVVESSA